MFLANSLAATAIVEYDITIEARINSWNLDFSEIYLSADGEVEGEAWGLLKKWSNPWGLRLKLLPSPFGDLATISIKVGFTECSYTRS